MDFDKSDIDIKVSRMRLTFITRDGLHTPKKRIKVLILRRLKSIYNQIELFIDELLT